MSDDPHHGPPSVGAVAVRRILRSLYVACAVLVLLDFTYEKHGHYTWEAWPGFHAGYGFVSCVLLVILATQLRKVVRRDEDYYDRD